MKILFIGDVFGRPGRVAVEEGLAALKAEHEADFVVVNGENSASGAGITSRISKKLLAAGTDVITTGNHIWRQREVFPFLDESDRIIRPANYLDANPGRGWTVAESGGQKLAVANLLGSLYIGAPRGAFQVIDGLLAEIPKDVSHILIDFHAEATSEKVALGHYLDGRVTALIGTHTHVQTADEKILPKGTAYISDAGMTGSRNSVIGVDRDIILQRFTTGMPVKFEVAEGDVWIEGVVVTAGDDGKATAIERFQVPAP